MAVFFILRHNGIDQKYGPSDHDDDVRENIINYADEGGGEDDMHAFDITPLRIPVDSSGTMISARGKQNIFNKPGILKDLRKDTTYDQDVPAYETAADMSSLAGAGQFIDPGVRLIDGQDRDGASRALDDLRNYAYEGCGSTAGSLSSLASIGNAGAGDNDGPQNFDYLSRWGPKFQNIAYLYSQNGNPNDDHNQSQNDQH